MGKKGNNPFKYFFFNFRGGFSWCTHSVMSGAQQQSSYFTPELKILSKPISSSPQPSHSQIRKTARGLTYKDINSSNF